MQSKIFNTRKLILTKTQHQALLYCLKKSKIFSKNVTPNLVARFIDKNLTINDLKNVRNYIKNKMQLVIHFNAAKVMKFLCKDTHYRNQYETKTSGGSMDLVMRTSWEDNMFNSIYHNDIDGSERVKYGAFNITNNPKGATCCRSYGSSYMVLKNDVKKRTTMVYGDSSCKQLHIGTFRYFDNILYYINDKLLNDVIEVALSNKGIESINYTNYIEAQYHGPIEFKYDIASLYIDKKHQEDLNIMRLLNLFSKKNGVKYVWI